MLPAQTLRLFNFRHIYHWRQAWIFLFRLWIKSLIDIGHSRAILGQVIDLFPHFFTFFLQPVIPHADDFTFLRNPAFLESFVVLEWVIFGFVVVLILVYILWRFALCLFVFVNQIDQVLVLLFILVEVFDLYFLGECISRLWLEIVVCLSGICLWWIQTILGCGIRP